MEGIGMALERVWLYQQCKAPDGTVGSFLKDVNRDKLVSPVFADSYLLFQWARANGWISIGGTLAREWRHEA